MSGDLRAATAAGWAQRALAVLCISGACVVSTRWLPPEPQAHAAAPAQVRVAGEPVDLDSDARATAARLSREYLQAPIELVAPGISQRVSRQRLGARVDRTHLASLLAQAADARSPLRRVHAQTLGTRPLALPMPASLDPTVTTQLLLRLKDVVDRPAVEPRVDPRRQLVVPAVPGVELDVYSTFERIERALRDGSGRVDAALASIPTRTPEHAFDHLEMGAILGEFETCYNRANVAADRTHNLKSAAAKIDGYVLAPGAVFDFNAVVGGRTASNGFRPAPVIADGELTDGLGGGTCQVASTLYAAAFFAGLPILTRFPHSRPSFYIKLGLDAAVVDGAQNLRFQNDRPYPIVVGVLVQDGRVYASLHGKVRDRRVTFIRNIDQVKPFEERITEDPSLPSGLRVLVQRGVPGFEVTRYRVVTNLTTHVSVRERDHDTYPPTAQLWTIGTGSEPPPGFVRPRNDPHPEYIAAEHLQMTQTDQGTYDVLRDPGRTGSYGWIEREGLMQRKP